MHRCGTCVPYTHLPVNMHLGSVIEAVVEGRSVFFTGAAGTGKSFLLNQIQVPERVVLRACSGLSRCVCVCV